MASGDLRCSLGDPRKLHVALMLKTAHALVEVGYPFMDIFACHGGQCTVGTAQLGDTAGHRAQPTPKQHLTDSAHMPTKPAVLQ